MRRHFSIIKSWCVAKPCIIRVYAWFWVEPNFRSLIILCVYIFLIYFCRCYIVWFQFIVYFCLCLCKNGFCGCVKNSIKELNEGVSRAAGAPSFFFGYHNIFWFMVRFRLMIRLWLLNVCKFVDKNGTNCYYFLVCFDHR